MESEKLGIDNLTKVLFFVLEAANVADRIGREKGMARWGHIFALSDEAAALSTVDFKLAKAEFFDLDTAERAALIEKAKLKFDLVDDDLETKIEAAFSFADKAVALVQEGMTLAKSFKKA